MSIERINPETLPKPHGFAHSVVTEGKLVFTSGQVGCDVDGKLDGEGTDYRAQARQTAVNVYAALGAADASPANIARLMLYVVDPTEATLEEVYTGIGEAAREVGAKPSAMTLIGVSGLSVEGAVVEMDATAVID